MSTNGYQTHGDTQMNIADLEVGQVLVETSSYGYGSETTFTEWTIAKILKTRLVLTRAGNVGPIERRVIVSYSTRWTYANGDVTRKLEGHAASVYTSITLYTADDPKLAELRKTNKLRSVRLDAERAIKELSGAMLSPERAQGLINTLSAYIESTNKED